MNNNYRALVISLMVSLMWGCGSGGGDNNAKPKSLISIEIDNPSSLKNELAIKEELFLKAIANYSDGSVIDITHAATWTSLDTANAIIIDKGLVKGIMAGHFTLKLEYEAETTNVDFTVINAQHITWLSSSTWAAYQDGPIGTWKKISLREDGLYHFNVSDQFGRFGIAEISQSSLGVSQNIRVKYVAISELDNSDNHLITQRGQHKITIDVVGTSLNQKGTISAGAGINARWTNPSSLTGLEMNYVRAGQNSLIGSLFDADAVAASRYYIERNVVVNSDINKIIDYSSSLVFDAASVNTVTANGLSGTETSASFGIIHLGSYGTNGNIARRSFTAAELVGSSVTTNWRGLPANQLKQGESYGFQFFASYLINNVAVSSGITFLESSLTNKTLTIPTIYDPSTFFWSFSSTGANVLSKFEFAEHTDAASGKPKYHFLSLRQQGAAPVSWSFVISHKWFDTVNNANIIYETPDFTSLAAWNNELNLVQGLETKLMYNSYHGDLLTPIGIRPTWPEGAVNISAGLSLVAIP